MQFGHFSVERKKIARLTHRSDNIDFFCIALVRLNDRHNLVVALIKCRPDQIIHSRIDNREFFHAGLFDVTNARQQDTSVSDEKTTRLDENPNAQLA